MTSFNKVSYMQDFTIKNFTKLYIFFICAEIVWYAHTSHVM